MQIIVFMITVLLLASPAVQAATIEQQRDWFQQARQALDKKQFKQFNRLKDKLNDYPLTPYLDIWHASRQLKQGDGKLVAATLLAYSDVPETIELRRNWLQYLAKKSKWRDAQRLLVDFPKLAKRFPEIAMMAQWRMAIESGTVADENDAILHYSKRWKQGKNNTQLSKSLHRAWLKKGHPTEIERWYRLGTFAEKGQWKKTRDLKRTFSKQQQAWLKYWRAIQKDPEQAFKRWPKSLSELDAVVPAALMMSDGIKRLSRIDQVKTWKTLQQLKSTQKQISPELFHELERAVALRAARQHKQIAGEWLAQLPLSSQNEDTRGWQVRLAIIAKDWPKTLSVIQNMPAEERVKDQWVYWQAHALNATGNQPGAKQQFSKLAAGRGYYNFLSAEQLDLPFQLEASDVVVSDRLMAKVENMPAIRRVSEWLELNKRSKALREWHFALAGGDQSQWKAAMLLASRWGWDDQVIRAAFHANEMDALLDRFPMGYEKHVKRAAEKTGLKPAEIWSIIRQESAFNQYAVSYVGAKGLMQLMPATARQVARKLKMGKGAPSLFSASTNIRLGTTYLAGIKERFGNLALAAAGYNAGPHRVSTWLDRVTFESPEAWVEAIPFNETRRYVKQVMAFITIYEWRQNKQPSSLVARLHGRVQEVSLNQTILVHDVDLN